MQPITASVGQDVLVSGGRGARDGTQKANAVARVVTNKGSDKLALETQVAMSRMAHGPSPWVGKGEEANGATDERSELRMSQLTL